MREEKAINFAQGGCLQKLTRCTLRLTIPNALAVVGVALLLNPLHREELVRVNLVQPDPDTHRERRPQVQRTPRQLPGVGQLRRIKAVRRAAIAALVLFLRPGGSRAGMPVPRPAEELRVGAFGFGDKLA